MVVSLTPRLPYSATHRIFTRCLVKGLVLESNHREESTLIAMFRVTGPSAFSSLLLIAFIISRCHPFKDNCECKGSLGIGPNSISKNVSLMGFVSKRISVPPDNISCFTRCIEECACKSFNFKRQPGVNGTHFCELNYESKETENAACKKRLGWDYYDITFEVSASKR